MYVEPTYNLDVWIERWDGTGGFLTVGNLAWGRRTNTMVVPDDDGIPPKHYMHLLLPKLTDVQDDKGGPFGDRVEVPVGTGRWYRVYWVDDAGKGFPNEHRVAVICKFPEAPWPVPIP